jgi:hypothetical protein
MHVVSGLETPLHRPGPEQHWAAMDFDRCVPRESVHKSAHAEVLLTDAKRLGDERFAVAARWNRDHYLAHHGDPAADPVLLMETARQAAIHLSHRFLDVPHGMRFVLSDIFVDLKEALPPVSGHRTLGLEVVCRPPAEGTRRLRLGLEADVLVGHRRIGRTGLRWEPMEPRRYALLRRRFEQGRAAARPHPEPSRVPLRPAHVGQLHERDVLIDTDRRRVNGGWLRLDQGHPVLFDHESDHVPGMALVEAFRQAGRVAAANGRAGASGVSLLEVSLLEVAFTSFGELEEPVAITASPTTCGGNVFVFHARQDERELARATVRCGAADGVRGRLGTAC